MSRQAIIASLALALAAMTASANAQTALSSCNPVTGTTPSGAPCVELTPIDPASIVRPDGAPGGEQYDRLNTATLGQTYQCRSIDGRNPPQYGPGGALLIEDCGTPLSASEIGPLKPFYGTVGTPTPIPAPPQVVAALPPAPAPAPITVPAPAPAFAPVNVAPAAGLSGLGLAAAGIGAAALVGLAAIALSDDDDNNSTGTTGQR